ncbi:UAA transporter [Multifurca ochricompacta]|uniref:UAA transporter n=1 Tax=Multifurca ochricompacta TaxID=376703 RepID=A0AAD4M0X0_9AGAM|nr:UAA transporter [Multifurca ochricompacta]
MSDWFATLGLVFGGCCSNALTLERITSEYPKSGSLITFSQFLLISLHGLPKFVTFTPRGPFNIPIPRLKPRRISLTPYLIQVGLFYFVSLLNNFAFGYNIPMAVHIIFRSGGLVISMLMGWLIIGKSFTISQVLSVLIVTIGVILTTLSSHQSHKTMESSSFEPPTSLYLTGIAILTLALVLSGFLGLVQERTYASYAKRVSGPPKEAKTTSPTTTIKAVEFRDAWEESMFYLHFLSLPMFFFVRKDILAQVEALLFSPRSSTSTFYLPLLATQITLPAVFPALLANTLTQLICAAGANRLTTRVPTLTVTLVLVVRKAVSLVLSVVLFDGSDGDVRWWMLWTGAFFVFAGTVGYTVSGKGKGSVKLG